MAAVGFVVKRGAARKAPATAQLAAGTDEPALAAGARTDFGKIRPRAA